MKHKGDAGFHVENSGASEFVLGNATRHGSERSQRVNGVIVTEQQHRLGGRFSSKVDLQMVAKALCRMDAYLPPEAGELLGDGVGDGIDGDLIVGRGFDFYELA